MTDIVITAFAAAAGATAAVGADVAGVVVGRIPAPGLAAPVASAAAATDA